MISAHSRGQTDRNTAAAERVSRNAQRARMKGSSIRQSLYVAVSNMHSIPVARP